MEKSIYGCKATETNSVAWRSGLHHGTDRRLGLLSFACLIIQNDDQSSILLSDTSIHSDLPKDMMEVKVTLTLAQHYTLLKELQECRESTMAQHYTLLKELQECRESLQQCRETIRQLTSHPQRARDSQSVCSGSTDDDDDVHDVHDNDDANNVVVDDDDDDVIDDQLM